MSLEVVGESLRATSLTKFPITVVVVLNKVALLGTIISNENRFRVSENWGQRCFFRTLIFFGISVEKSKISWPDFKSREEVIRLSLSTNYCM